MDNQPILSICIPTNGVVEWIIPVVGSIYAQNVNNDLFEVVITDNGGKDDLAKALQAYDYPNLHYYKTTAQGFTNQIDAFEKCSGLFCKMLNHRSKMLPGSLRTLIGLVDKYKVEKPIIYCAEGNAKGGEIIECVDENEFVRSLSYFVSWSAGTGAWKTDVENIRNIEINNMFPHTAFLFGLRENSKYVIWNEKYELMADDKGKGGYDLFRAFSVTFLDILNGLRIDGRISIDTFVYVKKELFEFIKNLYLNEVLLPSSHNFEIKDVAKSVSVYYGYYYYRKMVLVNLLKLPCVVVRYGFSKLLRRRIKE